ncbi:MAG: chromosome segregation protein SMC [Pirellulales bacterium]|nr:chromosome segregation protein SMC [Pirellulales bacterium]
MLQALELNGFKSFADRTRLEFPRGITVVVGPNGSGKSNVVDAIRWVLGSQSAKSLRGKEMTDVIFGGASNRRPANAAEASLAFDNSAGLLDYDAEQVQITRRVLRSGESEYLINRQPCRLRDVRELLAGVGAGAGSYNIIEQGKVDAMLQSSPKERRLVFEEAAGISRFRLKREEADRRLERVQQNLQRLADIVEELESRLKSVRAQAGRARKYAESAERLERLRTHVGRLDWSQLTQRIEALSAAAARETAQSTEIEAQVARAETDLAKRDAAAESLQADSQRIADEGAAVRERLATIQAAGASALARDEELTAETRRLGAQLVALSTRRGDSRNLSEQSVSELAEAEREFADLAQRVAAATLQFDGLQQELATVRDRAIRSRTALDEARREADATANRRELLGAKIAAAEATAARHAEEAAPLEQAVARHRHEAAAVDALLAAATAALAEATALAESAQTRLDADRTTLAGRQKQLVEMQGHLSGARERIVVLEELERRLDGLNAGAKEVLRRAREEPRGPFGGVRGIVADLLRVDADIAPLVEIALGERADYLVVSRTSDLAAALAEERTGWASRTTFLRLDVPQPASAVDRIDLSAEPGVIGRADQYVEATGDLAVLPRRLLGRFWLVESLETALGLSASVGRGLNFVTVGGEMLSADGAMVVGPRQTTSGLLSRRSELRALREHVDALAIEVEACRQECEQLERRIAEAQRDERTFAKRRTEAAHAHSDAKVRAAAAGEQLVQVEARLAAIAAQRGDADRRLAEERSEFQQCSLRLEELQTLIAAEEESLTIATTKEQSLAATHEALQTSLTEDRVALARSEQRRDGLRRQVEQFTRERQEKDRAVAEIAAQIAACRTQRDAQRLASLDHAAEAAELFRRKDALAAEKSALDARRQQRLAERGEAVVRVDALRKQLLGQQRRQQQQQLDLQQWEHKRTALADRMREDYKIDLAVAARGPIDDELIAVPRTELDQEIAELRDRVQAAGPVNLEAVDELAQLESRYKALAEQYDDLAAARERLVKIVSQINVESRKLFTDTVDEIREHFQAIFAKLFGGGEGTIVLEDDAGGDVLECGVSIVARPPGKQPRSISLLSGGERTLTCVALLLAIFKSRPSPFCVLDEVDAALDEANIDRYVSVIKEFMQSTQFIVVTHSKRTMMCADTLYGVTMQESGVSKRVSVRFEDVGEGGRIRAAALTRSEEAPDAPAAPQAKAA